jgi:hypothetical protein
VVGFRLAEVGEGASEDWGGSGVKLHYLDGVVDSKSETTDRRVRSRAGVGSVGRSLRCEALYHAKSRWRQ